jgi:DnaJ-class molecular chaperone
MNKILNYFRTTFLNWVVKQEYKYKLKDYIFKLGCLDYKTYNKKLQSLSINEIDYNKLNAFEKEIVLIPNPIIESNEQYKNIFNSNLLFDTPDSNIHYEIDVGVTSALNNIKIHIPYEVLVKCDCISKVSICEKKDCPLCNGSITTNESERVLEVCIDCFTDNENCQKCRGKFVNKISRSIELTISNNFYQGIIYSFPEMGNYDFLNKNYGYLKIKVNLIDDNSKNKKNLLKIVNETQIESEEKVSLYTMVFGGNIKVSHATGECEISLEGGNQPGDYKIVNNIGIPQYYDEECREMHRSCQIIFLSLKLPKQEEISNNPGLKNLFKELGNLDDYSEIEKLNKIKA